MSKNRRSLSRTRLSHREAPPKSLSSSASHSAETLAGIPDLPAHVEQMGVSSRRAISAAEERMGDRVLVLWQSTNTSFDHDDVQALRRIMPPEKTSTLHFCLTSTGGNGLAAVVLGDILRATCDRLIIHVPVNASSAATILAMHADEIHLAPGAHLSAVDASFTVSENLTINEVEFSRLRSRAPEGRPHRPGTADGYEHLFPHVPPMAISHALRSMTLTERLCQRALRHLRNPARRRRIIQAFLKGCPTHGYPVGLDEAQSYGLPAMLMPPDEQSLMLELHDLHLHYGRMHRMVQGPLVWRETTMRSIAASGYQTAAMVADCERTREHIDTPWHEIWHNNGWRLIDEEGACPRMPVELQDRN